MRLAVVIIALLCLTTGQVAADVDRGLEAYEAGNYETALEEWAVDAQDGDPVAQFLMGHLYESGLGLEADPVEAFQWYDLAASQDYKDAEIARDRVAAGMTDEQLALARGETEAAPEAETEPEATAEESGMSADEALLDAVLRDDVAQAANLLASGEDPNLRFSDGDPILFEAARQGFVSIVLTLIGAGAEIDAAGDSGWTPLMAAVDGEQDELAAILLRQGADPFIESPDGVTAYSLAVARDQGTLLALIGEAPEPERREPPSPDLLIGAAEAGDQEAVAAQIDAGVDVDAADGDGWTALMFAAVAGHGDVARTLIEAGARVNATASDGATALMAATLGRQARMVRLLLASGAKAGRRSGSGATALQIAEQNGFGEIADMLRPYMGPPSEQVAEVQSLLTRLGYAPGPVDGAMGPKTRGAIKEFQSSRGFKTNGRVTEALLSELRHADTQRVGESAAATAWAALQGSKDPADFLGFAAEFPNSELATEARNRASLLAVALMREKAAKAVPAQQAPGLAAAQQGRVPSLQTAGQQPLYNQSAGQPMAAQQLTAQQAGVRQTGVSRRSARRGTEPGPGPAGPTAAPAGQPSAQELSDWATVMGRGQAQDFAAYLEVYPNGAFVQQALYMLQQQAPSGGQPRPAGPGPQDLSPVTHYLRQRPQHFRSQVNAYNKQNRVVTSATQITYKVREIYEAIPFGIENGAYKVNVLMGVGNSQDSQHNAGLNVERVILYLYPEGNRFSIVGHNKDLGEVQNKG